MSCVLAREVKELRATTHATFEVCLLNPLKYTSRSLSPSLPLPLSSRPWLYAALKLQAFRMQRILQHSGVALEPSCSHGYLGLTGPLSRWLALHLPPQ